MRSIFCAVTVLSTLSLLGCSMGGSGSSDGKGGPSGAAASKTVQLAKLGLKGVAAGETDDPIVGTGDPVMIMAANFTVNVAEAKPTDPKTIKDAEAVAKAFNPKNLKSETLPDGWIVTFQNTGSMGENYWVSVRREIGGKGYLCDTTQNNPAQQKASIDFCKSLSK